MPFTNPVKTKLDRGETTLGCWLTGCSSFTAEVMGYSGIEWVMIDMEHGAGDYQTLVSQLQGLKGSSTVPLVRVPFNDQIYIKRVLDIGAHGVMIPLINNAAEARQAVASAHYPPDGVRGLAKGVRAYGFGKYFADYVPNMNKEILVILQIETKESVENIDEIADVEGIDVLFCGPSDLAVTYGYLGQTDHPLVNKAIARVQEAAARKKIPVGIFADTWDRVERFHREGIQFIVHGSDLGFVANGAKEIVSKSATLIGK